MNNLSKLLVLLALIIMFLMPSPLTLLAQESTPEATVAELTQPIQSLETVQQPLFDAQILSIVAGIATLFIVGGAFYVMVEALKIVGVSVPREVIDTVGKGLVDVMNQTMTQLETSAALTPTPLDDGLLNLASIPIEKLIGEIQKRNADRPALATEPPDLTPRSD